MSRWSEISRQNFTESEVDNDSPIECDACSRTDIPFFHQIRFCRESAKNRRVSPFGQVLDPRSKTVRRWNRAVLMARGVALAVDPLFLFSVSVGTCGGPCVYVDGGVAAIVAVIRTCVDAVHLCHVLIQFRLAYVSRESRVVGCGTLVWDAREIASHYLRSFKAFGFDAFVVVPLPQVVYWLVVPKLIREERTELLMTTLQLIFLFQFLPKVYHSFSLMQRMRKVTGFIFGSVWWGFVVNLIAYFLASHAAGGFWYILSIQRILSCLTSQEFYRSNNSSNMVVKTAMCLDENGPFPYGIYQFALPLISTDSTAIKILYSNLWGLMSLSTMGNILVPTSGCLEVVFCICVVLGGLMLFTLLIGNIQVLLDVVTERRRKMQVRYQDVQWWMRRRQLPSPLRNRVGRFERQRWAATGGVEDEMGFIKELPQGLRRDIKRHLCLDLIKKVPFFQCLEDVILDNVCDRVKPLVFSKGEKIVREGDPIRQMVFIIHGSVRRVQTLKKDSVTTTKLVPGSFLGDELLSWCLRRPFMNRLPPSSATYTCLRPTEAFGLDADDLWYITDHFRYRFASEKLKRTARYYSSSWRTWAAVMIQFAWRRYVGRTRGLMSRVVENGGRNQFQLQQYAAVFMSIRPRDHLE
ncbi:Cyclic nucleotide-gated ion channel like [Actinidia chinensis var. chinensis]|uniref:Cyclic nucleotide-gated ion channel like n=1 Tax=Actinidia chinensis var. chinensis TaxID=1590841 RepID=A0A2R6RUG6_ACTCC|nr:Cyclic nucleotide-gated ion channel like [Actinidia chinensis var. chinensis]